MYAYASKEDIFKLLGYAFVIFLSTISCFGSLFGDFVFDDAEAILSNNDVLTSSPITNLLINDFWGTRLTHNLSHKSYRPLTVLTFRWNYAVYGRLVAWSFHLVNIVLHVSVTVILWQVFNKLIGSNRQVTSLWATCLFAVHPVHTEAVCGIVGRADLLAALFFLISFLLYTRSTDSTRFWYIWLGFSILNAAAAMFSKEHGVTVLGFNLVYELLVIQKIDLWLLGLRRGRGRVRPSWLPETISIARCAILFVSACSMILLRCYLMDFRSPTFQKGDNPASFAENWLVRVATKLYIISLNSWIMLCPDWLCFDWSMGCIPLITDPFDPRVFYTFLFWTLLLTLVLTALFSSDFFARRDILLSLALLIVPFIPASNLLFRVGFVIAERVLYIPSAGFCLLVALGLERLTNFTKKDYTFAFSLFLMVLLIKSHLRSLEWRTEASLFNSALRVCPLNAKVRYNVAKSAADRGNEEIAIEQYKEALRLFPEYDQALNNLANLLRNRGEIFEAEKLLRRALKIRSDFPAAWMNLGIVLGSRKNYAEAEKCYNNALKLRKIYPDCYYNLGNLFLDQDRLKEAEEAWLNATKQKPQMILAWNNLMLMKDSKGNHSEAVAIAETAIEVAGEAPSFYFNMANALGKMADFESAEENFKKALQLDSTNALYYLNLGVLYHRWKRFSSAEEFYIKALKINPKLKSAKQNYRMLLKHMAKLKATNQST